MKQISKSFLDLRLAIPKSQTPGSPMTPHLAPPEFVAKHLRLGNRQQNIRRFTNLTSQLTTSLLLACPTHWKQILPPHVTI